MKKVFSFFAFIGFVILFQSCGSSKPSSFVSFSQNKNKGFSSNTEGATWASILIREDLTYDKAFDEVLDICAKRFEMDLISKEGGYGRSQWIYTWNDKDKYDTKYRTRIVFKFSPDKTKVDIKTEAEYGGERNFEKGWDTRLLQTMKQDIMGVVGRTTM